MAPTPLRKLLALQKSRSDEIDVSDARLRERERDSFNLNIVTSRIETLNKIWIEARSTHEDIITRDDVSENNYITENFFAEFQGRYEKTLDFLLTLQSELEASRDQNRNLSDHVVRSLNDNTEFELRAAKLPKLDLPTFSGSYEDWENFCDSFTTLVHNAPRLADATKLQYLKSCLKDTAADLVKDVATTNANYSTTWQVLKSRFHNPRLIVFNHLRALIDLPYLKKESASELRSFVDEAQRIVRALKNLKMPIEHWDVWFVFILSARLDPESRKAWETILSVKDRDHILNSDSEMSNENSLSYFPCFSDFSEFLENRARTLGMIASENIMDKKIHTLSKGNLSGRKTFLSSTSTTSSDGRIQCSLCTGSHRLHKCFKFKSKTSADRRKEIRRLVLCYNCFGPHKVRECTSTFRCKVCNEKHHTLLHENKSEDSQTVKGDYLDTQSNSKNKNNDKTTLNVHTINITYPMHSIILATAQITLIGDNGEHCKVRALLDQGSESSFVSSKIASLLKLSTQRVKIPLSGLANHSTGFARLSTRLKIRSLFDPSFQIETTALILQKLTSQLPSRKDLKIDLSIFENFTLADPSFYVPDSVDVILGADVYGQLLRDGVEKFPSSSLIAQNTALGWIISGPSNFKSSRRAGVNSQHSIRVLHCASDIALDNFLQKFWELEEISQVKKSFSPDEAVCEKTFVETHSRDENGRYVVNLPMKSDLFNYANETRRTALGSLATLHRRFNRDPKLASAYKDFMLTYEKLGHMKPVPVSELTNNHA